MGRDISALSRTNLEVVLFALSEDVIEREIRPDGKLYSKRLLTKTNHVPKWGEKIFRAKSVCIVEESIVDPQSKTLMTHTRNIGFNRIMVRSLSGRIFCHSPTFVSGCRGESRLQARFSRQDDRQPIRLDWLASLWIRDRASCLRLWEIQEELPEDGKLLDGLCYKRFLGCVPKLRNLAGAGRFTIVIGVWEYWLSFKKGASRKIHEPSYFWPYSMNF